MELHLMKLHPKSHYKVFHFHQYFHYTLQVIYQLFYFYTYNFYNLNILQHHMIYHIHTHNCRDSKEILDHAFLCQLILYIHICICLHSIFFYCYKHLHLIYNLHLHVLCHSICLVSLGLNIRLNTLTCMFLMVLGTHNLEYRSLIVLQLPLHYLL